MKKNTVDLNQIIKDVNSPAAKFHNATSIKKMLPGIKLEEWPAEWKDIHFKTYARMHRVKLKKTKREHNLLFKVIESRKSERNFRSYKITNEEISKLLLYSGGINSDRTLSWDESRRTYPSAGARYTNELYYIILNAKDIDRGLYHYNVKEHSLELLLAGNFIEPMVKIVGQELIIGASIIMVITAVLGRSKVKYGERAYRYSLIEAGHMAQNLYLVVNSLRLKCCAIGGFVDQQVNTLLDLDGENEFAIYLIAIGN